MSPLTVLEPKNPNELYVLQEGRAADFKAPKL